MLTASELDEARVVAIPDLDNHRSEEHWLCTHCRDLSGELEPDNLENVTNHLRIR